MKNFEQISAMLMDETAVKVLSTVCADGTIHSIHAGSVSPLDNDTMFVAEMMMNNSSANLAANGKYSVLVTKGMEGIYLLKGTATARVTEGELFDMVSQKMKAAGYEIKALWMLAVEEIYDNGADTTKAGNQIY
ncbi:MAG: pyridoxamine 5'-phosphate oxidase family protein [Acetobacterium sp.]